MQLLLALVPSTPAALAALADNVTVLVGHSGVGKSTLVNAICPAADRATGVVNVVTGRGRHTSTSAVALPVPAQPGTWVIDTPGVRSFGLGRVKPSDLLRIFDDVSPGEENCLRGCTHDEAECALDSSVASGAAGPAGQSRLESLRQLIRSRNDSSDL